MDSLLTVKQAAEFLQVSEMTIRRWSNAGLLPCYRIGRRRHRRFRLQDLQDYLARGLSPAAEAGPALGFGGWELPGASHLTHLYQDPEEGLALGAAYLKQGLESGESVLLVAQRERIEGFLGTLAGLGLDRAPLGKRLHTSTGRDGPGEMAEHIMAVAAGSRGGFRLLGDMLWSRGRGWSLEMLRELEEATSARLVLAGRLFLCQYSLSRFSGREVMMAMETHDLAVYRGRLLPRPSF